MSKYINYDLNFKDLLYYDPSSKSCLRWKEEKRSGRNYSIIHVEKDSEAGNLVFDKNGNPLYIDIRIGKTTFKAQRIVWLLHDKILNETEVIDHLDGNPHNNLIQNLQAKSYAENSRNRKKASNNTTGYTGIVWSESKYSKRYKASFIDLNGNKIVKSFTVSKYENKEDALKAAIKWRERQIEELNKNGANYTERHGK